MLVNLFSAEKKFFPQFFDFHFCKNPRFRDQFQALMFVSCVCKRRWRLGGRSAVKCRKAIFAYVTKRKSSSRTLYTCWNRVKKKKKKKKDFESLVLRKFRKITALSHPWVYIVRIQPGQHTTRSIYPLGYLHRQPTPPPPSTASVSHYPSSSPAAGLQMVKVQSNGWPQPVYSMHSGWRGAMLRQQLRPLRMSRYMWPALTKWYISRILAL